MVDTVLYFEGQSGHQFRILRAVKNRFGPTDEIAYSRCAMRDFNSREPSALFLSDRDRSAPGTAVFAAWRNEAILVEIQRLLHRLHSACQDVPWSDGTPTGSPCSSPCSRPAAARGLALTTSISMSRRAEARRSRRRSRRSSGAPLLLHRTPGARDSVYFGEVSLTGAVRALVIWTNA